MSNIYWNSILIQYEVYKHKTKKNVKKNATHNQTESYFLNNGNDVNKSIFNIFLHY